MSIVSSTVSSQFQTTLPKAVRTRLHLSKNDRVIFRLTESAVLLEKADAVRLLADLPQIVVNRSLFEAVLSLYHAKPALSAADCYLACAANARNETPLWTFDKALARQCEFAREPPDESGQRVGLSQSFTALSAFGITVTTEGRHHFLFLARKRSRHARTDSHTF